MRHNVVADDLLSLLCHVIIDIIGMRFQLFDLLIRNIQSQFLLCLRQSDPQPSPCPELLVRGKDILHLLACITLRKRADITIITHLFFSFS